jgi:hypothetical protein
VVALLVVAAAYLGKDLIREMDWYQEFEGAAEQARGDLEAGLAIGQELRQRYPAEDINLGTHTSFGSDPGRVLTVRIINPDFPLPDGSEGEPVAREIALFTASRFPSARDMRAVVIEVHRQSAAFSSRQQYEFAIEGLLPVDSLPGSTADSPGAPGLDTGSDRDVPPPATPRHRPVPEPPAPDPGGP